MNILVLNAGSSSLKFQVIATDLERIRQQLLRAVEARYLEATSAERSA